MDTEGSNKSDLSSGPFSRSLAGKLILSLGILILVGGGISWVTLIRSGKRNLINNVVENAASYSDIVRKSTRYSMVRFDRDAIQKTIEEVGARKGIEGLKIFDSSGRIFYSSKKNEIGRVVDRNADACAGCHEEAGRPVTPSMSGNRWLIHDGDNYRVLTFIEPLYNGPSCISSCHAHKEEQRVLGVLQTDFSLAEVDATIRKQTINITIYAFVFMALSAIAIYFVLRRFVLRPLSIVDAAMINVASGDLEQTVILTSDDEMGRLAATFNMMTKELADARKKLENWTKLLEEGIEKKTEELKSSQDRLIQAEKLASLGRLTADVAHEIRNPLAALGGFARRLYKIAEKVKEKEYAEIILTEAERLEKILKDVLTFSRDAKSHLEKQNVEDVLDSTLTLYADLCREQSISVEVSRGDSLLPVLMDKDQVRQALANLITNAVDAMPEGGRLTLTAGRDEMNGVTYMFIRVADTGAGIRNEDLPFIFEPFFTTKTIGHGTGLGLSITRKIMEEHGGFLKAENNETIGANFTLYFPYQSEEESPEIKCWEYMKCGRDKDCSLKCPAHPNFGRICWAVAGTFCEGRVQGTFAQKYEDCKKCEFYKKLNK